MNQLMNLVQRYHWSKGVREYKVEEPPLDSLAVTGNLEENASHHVIILAYGKAPFRLFEHFMHPKSADPKF